MPSKASRPAGRPAWAVAATGLGVVALVAMTLFIHAWVGTHTWLFTGHYAVGFKDLLSRTRDIWRIHHRSNLYSIHDHGQYFTYPPAALFVFWPLSWFSFRVDALWWTMLCLLALAGAIGVVWRTVRPGDPWVIAAGSLWGALASIVLLPVISIHFALGQLGVLIMVVLALDTLVLRGRLQGVGTGIATAVKIYPGVFIIGWLLRRQWRPALTAIAAAAVTTGAAWAIWPWFTDTFVRRQLLGGREFSHFLARRHWLAASSSPYTVFFRWPFHGGAWAAPAGWTLSLGVVALGLAAATRLWRAGAPAAAFSLTLGAAILFGPVTWDHYYSFAPLLVLVILENRRRLVLAGAAALSLVVYALPWQLFRNEGLTVSTLSLQALGILVARNALSATTVLMMLAALWVTRSGAERTDHPVAPPS